eukprot:NODE_24_length_41419_cov_0.818780.p18 type:complete len:273 gc:universal NODE_24_length_41419_cov_0.818780:16052-15234(-)
MTKLIKCLFGGQSFTWHHIENYFYKALKINNQNCVVRVDSNGNAVAIYGSFNASNWWAKYSRQKWDLNELYSEWSRRDPKLNYYPIYLLDQDPLECILGFICSSNNNIKRIQKMMLQLCALYGEYLIDINSVPIYTFPTLEQLQKLDEIQLRKCGFGYRAKYISESIELLSRFPSLLELHNLDYDEAKRSLMTLKGVGNKVADCILLMGFGFLECVPIDVHIKRCIEVKYNIPKQTLSDSHYRKLQTILKSKWGDKAGWAHLLAFADMRSKS